MKLQISFDLVDLDKALDIAAQVAPHASTLEVGSLLIYKHGVKAIERFRSAFPTKTILADTKIVDRGKEAVAVFAQAGADWVTVMAGTNKSVIHAVCSAAHNANVKVMIDLLDSSSLGQSALEAKSLGCDALLFHSSYDSDERLVFLDKWEMVRGNTTLPIYISSKITRETVDRVSEINPDGIVIGRAIIDAENPQQEAAFFQDRFSTN